MSIPETQGCLQHSPEAQGHKRDKGTISSPGARALLGVHGCAIRGKKKRTKSPQTRWLNWRLCVCLLFGFEAISSEPVFYFGFVCFIYIYIYTSRVHFEIPHFGLSC